MYIAFNIELSMHIKQTTPFFYLNFFNQSKKGTMRQISPHNPSKLIVFCLLFTLLVRTNAQEQVKIGFYKTGEVQLVVSEPFGGKMPDRGIIGLMVHVSGNVQNCDYIPANLNGKIIVIEAGQCGIIRSAQKAEKAGATAVVIIRSNGDEIIPDGRLINIPCFTVSPTTGGYYRQILPKPTLVSLSLPNGSSNGTHPKTAAKVENLAIDAQTKAFLERKSAETTETAPTKPVLADVSKPVEAPPAPKVITSDPVPAPIVTAATGQPVATTISGAPIPSENHATAPHTNKPVGTVAESRKPIEKAETVVSIPPSVENTAAKVAPPPAPIESTSVAVAAVAKPIEEPAKTVSSETLTSKSGSETLTSKSGTESSKTAISEPSTPKIVALNQAVTTPEVVVSPTSSNGTVAADPTAYLKEALEIFPRRTADVTIVNYNFEKKMNLTITLKTESGQIIKDYKVEGQQFGTVEVEVTALPNGKYVITVADDKQSIEQHIIVEH
ncbi:MAG: hypothetical protein RIS64_2670 [Bacteroidota bacterium]